MSAMRKTEDHHHTAEQVDGYLVEALMMSERHMLTEDVRAAILPTLVSLLSSKQVFYEQAAPVGAIDLNQLRARH
jgi:hypothetical protein